MINVIIAGPRGKMGKAAVNLVMNTEHFHLAAVMKLSEIDGFTGIDVPVYTDHEKCFSEVKADVLIDLTTPESGRIHTLSALTHHIRPVVGTTGFSDEDLKEIERISKENGIGCIIAPNFAVGAVLMMKFAKQAAKYFPDVDIIELHHD